MGRIELSGKSQGKGRNGYFQLHSVELMNMRTDPDGQVLHVDFYPRRRVNCVGPARLLLSVEDAAKLAQLFREAVECRPPVANIEQAQLVCECGHRGAPRLRNRDTKFPTSWSKLPATRSSHGAGMDRADLCRKMATRTGWRAIAAESCTRFRRSCISIGDKVTSRGGRCLAGDRARVGPRGPKSSRIFRMKRRIQWLSVV